MNIHDHYELIAQPKALRLSNPVTDPTYTLTDMVEDMKEVRDRILTGESVTAEREWLDWAEQKMEDWASL